MIEALERSTADLRSAILSGRDTAAALDRWRDAIVHAESAAPLALDLDIERATSTHGSVTKPVTEHSRADSELEVPPVAQTTSTGTSGNKATDQSFTPMTGEFPEGRVSTRCESFVGRRRELVAIRQRFASKPLVTLIGPGGVGKTTLALRVVSDRRLVASGRTAVVGLDALRDPSLLVDVVAGAVGVRTHSTRPLLDSLADFIGKQSLLLLLDNCEHIAGPVASIAESLLEKCPRLRILATSREPLGLTREGIIPVLPLPVPEDRLAGFREIRSYDSVILFVERAKRASRGFELSEENAADVVELCTQLEGLPLAIELAAARLQVMSPKELLARLSNRFNLLESTNRDIPPRQRTLRMCVDWSYELCSVTEQLVWMALSTFAETFEFAAGESVCGLSCDVYVKTVTSLANKCILAPDSNVAAGESRLGFLETLREYGRERAKDSGKDQVSRERHCDWYVRLASEISGMWASRGQAAAIAKISREQSNLRVAMDFGLNRGSIAVGATKALEISTSLYPFWLSRGMFGEGRYWLGRSLDKTSKYVTVTRAMALHRACALAVLQGDTNTGNELADAAEILAGELQEDSIVVTFAAYTRGLSALYNDSLEVSRSSLEVATRGFRENSMEYTFDYLGALITLGWAHQLLGNVADARSCHETALAITEESGEMLYRSHASWGAGVAMWLAGDNESALKRLRDGLELSRRGNDPFVAAMCLESLSWIFSSSGDARRAAVLEGAADSLARSIGASSVIFPGLRRHHEGSDGNIFGKLSKTDYLDAVRLGKGFGFFEAIRFALGEEQPDIGRGRHAPVVGGAELTARERQIVDLVAEGLSNNEIASRLVISPRTAQGHVGKVLAKLGLTNRAQVAAWAVKSYTTLD